MVDETKNKKENILENKLEIVNYETKAKKSISFEDLNNTNDEIYKPAFKHLSSPKLSKIGYNRSRSGEKSRRSSPEKSLSRGFSSNESFHEKNQSYYSTSPSPVRHRSQNNDYEYGNLSQGLFELRRKYEKEVEMLKSNFQIPKTVLKTNHNSRLPSNTRQILSKLDLLKVNFKFRITFFDFKIIDFIFRKKVILFVENMKK